MSGQGNLQSIRQLFEVLCPLNSSERNEYLNSHPELSTEIVDQTLRLLQADGNDALLRLDTVLPSAFVPQRELQPGDRLGSYSLVRLLGSGGMGMVYEAVRREGDISLRTAIKLLHPELCTPGFLLQLRNEVSTLASLSHPNIARLLDWELGQSGDSFFVLEYVEGEMLTVFCRRHSLDVRARLRLFLDVCSAVCHAHQKLIAHLDLKPENILVNAAGEVKLLDFGVACTLAKTGSSVVSRRPLHGFSARYASPEQINGGSISALSDVYSLGVVLRELLSDSFQGAAKNASASRLSFELEAIAARASAHKPANRYASVEELRRDVLRFLSTRPVQAVPQSRSYLLSRFCRRNSLHLIVIAMAAGLLLVGSVALYKQREERLERQRVERLRQSVHQLSSTILFPLEDEIRNLPGATPARMLAVQTGLQFLKGLADEGGSDPKLRAEVAEAYLKLGDIQGNPTNANLGDDKGAYESYEMARHLLADNRTPEERYVYGVLLTHEGDLVYEDSDKQTAAKMYGESVRLLSELNRTENTNNKVKESLELALNDVADVQSEERRADLARSNYDKALDLAQQLIVTNPGDITLQRDLARCYSRHGDLAWNAGDWQAALPAYRKSFDIYDRLLHQYPDNIKVQHSWIAGANNVADTEDKLNRPDEALDLYNRVQRIEDRAVSLDPGNKMALRDQQVGYSNLTRVLLRLNNLAAAENACHHELAIAKALWQQNKQSALTVEDLSGAEEHLAEVESKQHRYSAAVSTDKQALQLRFENLRNGGSADNLADVINALVRLGNDELDLASAIPSAKKVALDDVAKTINRLHQLKLQFQPGTAEDKRRVDGIRALEERYRKCCRR